MADQPTTEPLDERPDGRLDQLVDQPVDQPVDEPLDEPLDELSVTGIECFGHHGVFDHERRAGQPFVIDLTLGVRTRRAATSDDLRDTVDYGSLVAAVKAAVERDPVDLIETLAQRISDVCLTGDRAVWARVTVHKPDAPIDATFSDVALTITRGREGQA